MANINFTDFESKREKNTFADKAKVGYFSSLKEDGDEAVVRLNYNTKADFKVVTVHRVLVENNWRNVECLRGLYDTKDKCPLCASDDKMKSKIFVQLLQYVKNEDGNITVEPKIWERGYGFVPELLDTIADAVEDGKITADTPIRDIVFKVKRMGAKGSLDTKYKLKVMQPAVVPEDVFVKDFSAFEGFDSAHHDYYKKTEDEIKYYLEHKKFPEVAKEEAVPDEEAKSVPAKEPVHPGVTYEDPFGDDDEPVPAKTEPADKPAPVKKATPADKPAVNRYNW